MGRVKIILADTDEGYLLPLEHRFVKGFGERADFVLLSDRAYFDTYFSTPQQADILVISEALFSRALERHDLANVFILSEHDETVAGELNAKRVLKYTSPQEIFLEVRSGAILRLDDESGRSATKVVLVYSPVGGAGATSVALGVCGALAQSRKKALFVSTESLQTFSSFLSEDTKLSFSQKLLVTDRGEGAYDRLKAALGNEGFDYLPPFAQALMAMNLKTQDFLSLFDLIKSGAEYDYLVVEAPREFSQELSTLMGYADQTVVVAMQDKPSVYKLECLLKNINYVGGNRFLLVCGRFRSEREDVLAERTAALGLKVAAQIPESREFPLSAAGLAGLKVMRKLSFTFV